MNYINVQFEVQFEISRVCHYNSYRTRQVSETFIFARENFFGKSPYKICVHFKFMRHQVQVQFVGYRHQFDIKAHHHKLKGLSCVRQLLLWIISSCAIKKQYGQDFFA